MARSESGNQRTHLDATFAQRNVSLHFDEPYNCRIEASFLDSDGNTTRYRFKPSINGGHFCDGLYPGALDVTRPSDTAIELSFKNGGAPWKGSLKKENVSH